MTPAEQAIYRKGFRAAMSFLYDGYTNSADKSRFESFLLTQGIPTRIVQASKAQPNKRLSDTTPAERSLYQKGYKVAINFLYHHTDSANISAFKNFLDTQIDQSVVEESIALQSDDNCEPGYCQTPRGCQLCDFDYAYDGRYLE